jgi:hypothetical protein
VEHGIQSGPGSRGVDRPANHHRNPVAR